MNRLILSSIPCRYCSEQLPSTTGTPSCAVGGETIVWVGLDRESVDSLVNDCGQDVGDEAAVLLRAMIANGDIDISREYTVTVSVTLSGSVSHTVEATSETEASEKVSDMLNDGDGLDDFYGDADLDFDIEDVEAY